MKPTRQREPRDMLASDTAASHFVPLGHVVENIVRSVHEKRTNQHMAPARTDIQHRRDDLSFLRRGRRPVSAA